MRKTLFGGLMIIAGAIMFSIGSLDVSGDNFRIYVMEGPKIMGILFISAGTLMGVLGMCQ